jgi:serine phosphatase RsbU (regulator of sigma subunit)
MLPAPYGRTSRQAVTGPERADTAEPAENRPAVTQSSVPVIDLSASIRVLLVEDNAGDALLTCELLASSGFSFDVRPARQMSEAITRIGQGIDCVLLDLGLPDAGGIEALDQILVAAPTMAVIVLTGRSDRGLALAAVARGAQDYLQKGELDAELLSRSVRYAVERKRSDEAARRLLANELLAAESARLERGLLARPMLANTGWRWAARYRPGGGSLLLGGDFYDAIELPDGAVRVVIGDVSGHGPDEAAIGVALRIAWRSFVLGAIDPAAVLTDMQVLLRAERLSETLFVTVCDATIAADRRSVTLRVAGHPPPIVIEEHARELEVDAGPPLGIFDSFDWGPQQVHLPEQWALVFYTDGLIEGRSRDDPAARLGTSGLIAELRSTGWSTDDLGGLADQLLRVAEHQNGGPMADDIALFAIAEPVEREPGRA